MTETIVAAAPLVSKAEHLLGEKTLKLIYRWGDPVTVKVKALPWREMQRITSEVLANKLDHHEQLEAIIKASLGSGAEDKLLDKLGMKSAAILQNTALALCLGETEIKNVPGPVPQSGTPASEATTGSKSVGEPSAPLLQPVGAEQISPPGQPPSSLSRLTNISEGAPAPINANS